MAFQMEFKDQYGNELPSSYWRLVQANVSIPDKAASLVFYGYVSKEARDAKKQPVASKQYAVMGEKFEDWYVEILTGETTNLAKSCYDFAKDTRDVTKDNAIISFFADAVNV